jgi:DNA-binding NarL/FixJ family response regulator
MIRVLIADDHAIVRDGVQRLLSLDPEFVVVAVAKDGEDALALLGKSAVDVAIVDLSLPKLGGVELIRTLRATYPALAIVVLTMYPEDQLALHMLSLGVFAYLSKSRGPEEILCAVRAAARGERYLTDTLSELSGAKHQTERLPHQSLSPREYQVFLLLISGKTVSEVGYEMELSTSTVSNHVSKIREKLGAASLGEILRYANRVGLL